MSDKCLVGQMTVGQMSVSDKCLSDTCLSDKSCSAAYQLHYVRRNRKLHLCDIESHVSKLDTYPKAMNFNQFYCKDCI